MQGKGMHGIFRNIAEFGLAGCYVACLSVCKYLSPNRSREGSAQINCVCVSVCVYVCVSVRHHLNAYISETL